MDLSFSQEDLAFRDEVRQFIAENFSSDLAGIENRSMTKEEFLAWHKILHKKGWAAPSWPVEYGGAGWSMTQRYIWGEETAAAGTIQPLPFGVSMVGPVIYTFGNEEQKRKYLPRILSGEDWWCQGYSEPGSGSDLASLRTKAVREGDHYVVNGQKTWTTLAQHADWIFCLVRTNPDAPKPQMGISFLLIDMKTPGVSVRPIISMDGAHEVNDVFLDNVRVPVENLIGEENQGWTYAKFLLAHERSGIAGVARSKKAISRIRELADAQMDRGKPLSENPVFRDKVSQVEIDLTALEFTELRSLANESKGGGPGPESSILKIRGTEIQQRLTELALEAVGGYAQVPYMERGTNLPGIPEGIPGIADTYFNNRKTSIYGGSNEIQRNIIAKMVLGL